MKNVIILLERDGYNVYFHGVYQPPTENFDPTPIYQKVMGDSHDWDYSQIREGLINAGCVEVPFSKYWEDQAY